MNLQRASNQAETFRPRKSYIGLLWLAAVCFQLGLIYLKADPFHAGPLRSQPPWEAWLAMDAALVLGCLHATLASIRIDDAGIEFLAWRFTRTRRDWDEVVRLEAVTFQGLSRFAGARYTVTMERGRLHFGEKTLERADRLASLIIEYADLDDLGEGDLTMGEGSRRVWESPSADDA